MLKLGDKVFLKACHVGEPGKAISFERRRFTVYWADLDFCSRHPPDSLEQAEQIHERQTERINTR
jgi:hypothetical protein